MGKKRVSILGTTDEEALRAKSAVKREQKKLRIHEKSAKPPGPSESLAEYATVSPTAEATPKRRVIKTRSAAYQRAKHHIDPVKHYSLTDGLELLRRVSLTRFDPTVELHLTLKDKPFTTEVDLPHATGKMRRVAVADAETVAKIAAGRIDFDVLLASPAQMPQLVKFAKTLGPRGLMPNPKTGTVVADPLATAQTMASRNSLLLRTEKDAPLIHVVVGKLSHTAEQLFQNISAVLAAVGDRAHKVVLKTTMSPAVKLALPAGRQGLV